MSGWTVVTLRSDHEYEPAEYDDDPWPAFTDICATAEADDKVRKWTSKAPNVFAYLNCKRYDWEFAEALLEDYSNMVRDAVVLGANDTTDTGTARYYTVDDIVRCTDEYKETQADDGLHVGYMALQIIGSRHNIVPRDPWHHHVGLLDDRALEDGDVGSKVMVGDSR